LIVKPIQWVTNLPNNMTVTITMYSKAGTQVAPFSPITTSVYSTNTQWAPVRLIKACVLTWRLNERLIMIAYRFAGLLSRITYFRASTTVGQ